MRRRGQVGLRKHHYEQSQWRWWNSSWAISNPQRWCCESAALNMPANLKNSAVATGLEKVSFHSNPKEKKNAQTTAQLHSSHMLAKWCSKFSKPGFNYEISWTVKFQMFKLVLEKAEEPEIKLPTSTRSSKKQESSRKTSTSALLTTPKPLTVCITTNWKILKEMGIPNHLTCLLRNLYAGQEETVRTEHGTTDWFQIGKGVVKAVYCHLAYLTYIQSTSWEILACLKHKLESRLPGEISITSDMQMTPPLWQEAKRN